MVKIRIGKPVHIKWKLTYMQRPITPEDNIALFVFDKKHIKYRVTIRDISDGTLFATFQSSPLNNLGPYTVTAYANFPEQPIPVDAYNAFELVPFSNMEEPDTSFDENNISIYSDFNIGITDDYVNKLKDEIKNELKEYIDNNTPLKAVEDDDDNPTTDLGFHEVSTEEIPDISKILNS